MQENLSALSKKVYEYCAKIRIRVETPRYFYGLQTGDIPPQKIEIFFTDIHEQTNDAEQRECFSED